MSLPRAVHAVVFDMDGLLVDSETVFRDAILEAAGAIGRDLPVSVVHSTLGLNAAQAQSIWMDHFGGEFELAEFQLDIRQRFHRLSQTGILLKAGVVELLDHLDAAGLPRAIATSSAHAEVDRNLKPHGLKDRFHAVIARGDYPRGKPHPDPFLKAAEALGAAPENCLALEDSHNGVRAAHAAGMMTIMVPDLLEPTEEMRGLCVRIAKSLHEVRDLIIASAPEEPV